MSAIMLAQQLFRAHARWSYASHGTVIDFAGGKVSSSDMRGLLARYFRAGPKYRKSGGGWSFLEGMTWPSALRK